LIDVTSTEEASIFGEEDIYLLLLLNIKNENFNYRCWPNC